MAFPALLVLRQKGRKNRLYIWEPGSSPRKRRFYGIEGDPEAVARYEYDRALWELRGTEIDRQFGAETAVAVLGHANVSTTLCYYIDPRREQADEIARKCG